jgi:putative chitinase
MITLELLQKLCPKTKRPVLEQYVEPLIEVAEYYEMNTPERIAGFIAQCAHESGGFTATEENLNYSAKGLNTTFKKYFPTLESALPYERKPERIANRVYANRMGNGDEASGDGFRYRGRGLIQLTGKNNYERFAKDLGITVEECAQYLSTPGGAVSSAGWFFDQNNLLALCDKEDMLMLTKRINGGVLGLQDRLEHYHKLVELLS